MDYEEVANVTLEEDVSPGKSMEFIVHEVMFTMACFFGIVADAFIIYIMFRFKRMKAVPNMLLAHWAMVDLLSLIFTPSAYRLIYLWGDVPMSHRCLCILLKIGSTLHIMTIWFAILITIDWFIATYFENASEKLHRYYKHILATLWILGFLFASSTGGMCLSDDTFNMFQPFIIFVSYCAILLLVIVFQISRAIQKCRRKFVDYPALMLNLVTAIVVNWFLGFLSFFIMLCTMRFYLVLAIIGEFNIFCSSIVIFILLCILKKDFRRCFVHVIKRTKDDYNEAELDFANPVFNRNTIVKVSFKNDHDVPVC